ncbi:MAG: hypothetical protein OXG02_03150, partial [Chloroflexi bacterium]|nr:hypothetical protein [Chloroflexota bacterium]
ATPRHATPRHATPRHATPRHATPRHASNPLRVAEKLAAVYDEHCESVLLPLPRMNECETRLALDAAVIEALGIDAEIVATIRRELTREPSITGKRYV